MRARREAGERKDFYDELTEIVRADLERDGTLTWQKPWDESRCGTPLAPFNPATGTVYKGSNFLRLALDPRTYLTGDPRFVTFKNCIDNEWSVRKGSHGIHLIHWGARKNEHDDADESRPTHRFMQPHPFVVFHASDVDHIPAHIPTEAPARPAWEKPPEVVTILDGFGVPIREVGEKAYYSPQTDHIGLPPLGAFPSPAHWSAVALHEAGHATGHASRLNRDISGGFGSEKYANEELVAEFSSLFIGATLGLPVDTQNYSAYIGHWLSKIAEDKRYLAKAAGEAQKAANLLLSHLPANEPQPEFEPGKLDAVLPASSLPAPQPRL